MSLPSGHRATRSFSVTNNGIRRAHVKRHIVDGDHVATIFDLETDQGVEHVCDYIEITGGKIARVDAFCYPRPDAPGWFQPGPLRPHCRCGSD